MYKSLRYKWPSLSTTVVNDGKCGQEHLYKSIKEDSVLSRTTKVSAGAVCRKNSLFSGAPSVPTTDFVRGKGKESVVFRGGERKLQLEWHVSR